MWWMKNYMFLGLVALTFSSGFCCKFKCGDKRLIVSFKVTEDNQCIGVHGKKKKKKKKKRRKKKIGISLS
jgi:hypothetical protein